MTIDFLHISGSPEAQSYTIRQAKCLAMTAIDIMCQPNVMRKIRQEFKDATNFWNIQDQEDTNLLRKIRLSEKDQTLISYGRVKFRSWTKGLGNNCLNTILCKHLTFYTVLIYFFSIFTLIWDILHLIWWILMDWIKLWIYITTIHLVSELE